MITEVFPPQSGGSGRWFWEIYRRLDPHQTTILAGAQADDEAFDQTHNLNVQRTPMSFSSWGVVSRAGMTAYRGLADRVASLIREKQPEQLHCGKMLPEGFVAWWLKRKTGLPYLCYVHGEELNIAAHSRELRWMANRVFRSADRVIANSQNTATLLRKDWSVADVRLSILHPGADIERFCVAERDPGIRQQLGWDDRPVILTVGRLQKRKGQDQLIRALPVIRLSHPGVLYSIVGDGPERDALAMLADELEVNDHVEFRGNVCDQEMVRCYQQCDVFALPNRTVDGDFEGFGMVLVEAQACGRPVIAGDSGGTGEAMLDGHTGYRLDCQSPSALAKRIGSVLSNRESSELMGRAGRQWAAKNFGWDSLLEQAKVEFQSISARKRSG